MSSSELQAWAEVCKQADFRFWVELLQGACHPEFWAELHQWIVLHYEKQGRLRYLEGFAPHLIGNFSHEAQTEHDRERQSLAEECANLERQINARFAALSQVVDALLPLIPPELVQEYLCAFEHADNPDKATALMRRIYGAVLCKASEPRVRALVEQGATQPVEQPEYVFRLEGEIVLVRGFGKERRFTKTLGFEYLAKLVEARTGAVKMTELVGLEAPASSAKKGEVTVGKDVFPEGSTEERVDAKTIAKVRARLEEVRGRLGDTEFRPTVKELVALEAEKAELESYLASVTTLGGKPRKAGSETDKLRAGIHSALQRAYKALEGGGLAELAEHFKSNVHADADSYRYDNRLPWGQ